MQDMGCWIHIPSKKNKRILWKDTTLRFLQELMVQQNYCVCIYLEINTFTGQGANGSETNLRTREACYLFLRTWKGAHYWTVMKELLLVWNPSGDHILMQYAYSLVKLLRFQRCYEKTSLLDVYFSLFFGYYIAPEWGRSLIRSLHT